LNLSYQSCTRRIAKKQANKDVNAITNKDPFPLPFTYKVINNVNGLKVYTFLDTIRFP